MVDTLCWEADEMRIKDLMFFICLLVSCNPTTNEKDEILEAWKNREKTIIVAHILNLSLVCGTMKLISTGYYPLIEELICGDTADFPKLAKEKRLSTTYSLLHERYKHFEGTDPQMEEGGIWSIVKGLRRFSEKESEIAAFNLKNEQIIALYLLTDITFKNISKAYKNAGKYNSAFQQYGGFDELPALAKKREMSSLITKLKELYADDFGSGPPPLGEEAPYIIHTCISNLEKVSEYEEVLAKLP